MDEQIWFLIFVIACLPFRQKVIVAAVGPPAWAFGEQEVIIQAVSEHVVILN